MTKKKNPGDMPSDNNKNPDDPEREIEQDAEVEIIEEEFDAAAENAGEGPALEKEELLNSLMSEDMYLAGTLVMFLCFLTVIGTLISDILLALIDPRIQFEKS